MNNSQNTNNFERLSDLFQAADSNSNDLWQYLQSLSPETAAKLSQPSQEALQVMQGNIAQMLGTLPPQHFAVTVSTSRESLGQMIASAMMTGYFLKSAENRMVLDNSLNNAASEN